MGRSELSGQRVGSEEFARLELLSRIWYRTDLRHELVSGENGQKFLRAGRHVLGIPPGAQVLLLAPADPTVALHVAVRGDPLWGQEPQ